MCPEKIDQRGGCLQMFFVIIREHSRESNAGNIGKIGSTRGTHSDPAQIDYAAHLRTSFV